MLVVPHASNGAVARSVLVYRGFSWGLWVLGGALALPHLHGATPDGATPTAAGV